MASGISYRRFEQGTALVVPLGSAAAPSILFGNDNAHGGLNDGFYGTTGPAIGVSINGTDVGTFTASGLSFVGSLLSSSPTAGIGYSTGAGGTVTQATSKATGVTLSTITGAITTAADALAAGAEVTFVVTNTVVAAADTVIVHHTSGGTSGAYLAQCTKATAGTFDITIANLSAGSLSEAIVLRFTIIKSVSA